MKGEGFRARERRWESKSRHCVLLSQMQQQGGATSQGERVPPEAGKGQEADFPLEPLEGSQPCHHLDCSPSPILDLGAPELCENTFVVFTSLSLWQFVTTAVGN